MPGAISQIQVLYDAEEDRILLRVNSTSRQEFRFWITRRFSILLLRVLGEYAQSDPDISLQADSQARQTVQEFKREQAVRNAELDKPFREDGSEFPLGETVQLAYRLTRHRFNENLRLGIHPKTGEGINIVIDRGINANLTQLMLKAVNQAQWNLAEVNPMLLSDKTEKPIIN
jgi:hypothetical protein